MWRNLEKVAWICIRLCSLRNALACCFGCVFVAQVLLGFWLNYVEHDHSTAQWELSERDVGGSLVHEQQSIAGDHVGSTDGDNYVHPTYGWSATAGRIGQRVVEDLSGASLLSWKVGRDFEHWVRYSSDLIEDDCGLLNSEDSHGASGPVVSASGPEVSGERNSPSVAARGPQVGVLGQSAVCCNQVKACPC